MHDLGNVDNSPILKKRTFFSTGWRGSTAQRTTVCLERLVIHTFNLWKCYLEIKPELFKTCSWCHPKSTSFLSTFVWLSPIKDKCGRNMPTSTQLEAIPKRISVRHVTSQRKEVAKKNQAQIWNLVDPWTLEKSALFLTVFLFQSWMNRSNCIWFTARTL